ncbi:MAG: hypothetical protein WD535_02655 [Thermaerobacterales bacterium]
MNSNSKSVLPPGHERDADQPEQRDHRQPDSLRAGDDPAPLTWIIAALITAFVVGSLFRGYTTTGIAFFRMFGTIGIVMIGYFGSRALYVGLMAEGRRSLREHLAALPGDWLIVPGVAFGHPEGSRATMVEYLLVGRHSIHLLAVNETAAYARPASFKGHARRQAKRLWQAYRLVNRLLQTREVGTIGIQPHLLSTLRRPDDATRVVDGISIITLDHLTARLQEMDAQPDPEGSYHQEPLSSDQRSQLKKLFQLPQPPAAE